jgi:hypothetical protein
VVGIGAAILVIGVGLYFVFELFWPVNALTLSSITFPKTVIAGKSTIYEASYCRHTDLPATVDRTFVGVSVHSIVPLPEVVTGGPVRCDTTKVPVLVPASVIPGTYRFTVFVSFQLNAFRNVTVRAQSNVFQVRSP